MRAQEEIDRARRRLIAVLSAEPVNPFVRARINAYADALCWVLDETHDYEFGRDLANLDEFRRLAVNNPENLRAYAQFRRFQEEQEDQETSEAHTRRQILHKLHHHFGHHGPNEVDPSLAGKEASR